MPDPQFHDGVAIWLQNQLTQGAPTVDLNLQQDRVTSRSGAFRRTMIVASAVGFLALLVIARKRAKPPAKL